MRGVCVLLCSTRTVRGAENFRRIYRWRETGRRKTRTKYKSIGDATCKSRHQIEENPLIHAPLVRFVPPAAEDKRERSLKKEEEIPLMSFLEEAKR
jgi:hypothetical protein